MAGNRWTGLALVALLALIAQPAAVVATPTQDASVEEDEPATTCSTQVSVDDPGLVDRLVATEAELPTPVCLDDAASGVTEDIEDTVQATASVDEPRLG